MAVLNGNNAYLSFKGINISGYWTDTISLEASAETVDVTAGSGATHMERAVGLRDNKMSFTVIYDTVDLPTYLPILIEGSQGDVVYGPESNVTGKPKFQCDMILESVSGPSVAITKDRVGFELSFVGAAAPVATIAGGSTF